MQQEYQPESEVAAPQDRLSKLGEASLRINESLDLERVLQGVLDSACSLTNARCGVITTLDESGEVVEFVTSGLAAVEREDRIHRPSSLNSHSRNCYIPPEPPKLQWPPVRHSEGKIS